MANISSIYNQAIDPTPREGSEPSKDAATIQAEVNWQNASITKRFFKALEDEANVLEKTARNLAVSYHSHQNHNQIVQLLIRSAELRKILSNYASRNDE